MKNWRTTLLGALGGLTMLVKGYLLKDSAMMATGAALIMQGYFTKDNAVSGTGA